MTGCITRLRSLFAYIYLFCCYTFFIVLAFNFLTYSSHILQLFLYFPTSFAFSFICFLFTMLAEIKIWLLLLALLVVSSSMQLHVHAVPQVPCFFIFGDSLVDNGNNNGLQTKAVSNYPPYGIDLPQGPTGRFTNGLTTADILGNLIELSISHIYKHDVQIRVLKSMRISNIH